jgi:hypothetical protein
MTEGLHNPFLLLAGGRFLVEQMADTGHKLAVTTSRDQDLGGLAPWRMHDKRGSFCGQRPRSSA